MRSLESWLSEYSESHQNKTNQCIHKVCVPAIFFSVLGMLWVLKAGTLNAAIIAAILILPFYVRLGMRALILVLPQLIVSFVILYFWEINSTTQVVFFSSLTIFIVAWVGQFIGHKIEGKKPSFFKDLQFLLIGPLWVVKK